MDQQDTLAFPSKNNLPNKITNFRRALKDRIRATIDKTILYGGMITDFACDCVLCLDRSAHSD